jgi:hypothetical protein
LAHAASLRQTSFFARWKFRGFLHSFFLKGAGLDAAPLQLSQQTLTPVGDSRDRPILPDLGLSEDAHTNRGPFTFH